MNKSVKTVLLVLGIAVLWGLLASIDAGILGFGVIVSVLALLDVVTGEFEGNNKLVWLVVILAALLFAVVGIGSELLRPADAQGDNPVRTLSTAIALILPVAYFIVGRRQKIARKLQS